MSEKYFNIDIDDPRTSAIAEVMSNKTAKKILSLIAEKELTESDIANELSLPLNTVGYNIDKLLRAGLIEKSKNFFWSTKGKKMPTYKLSNKKILISPKKMISSVPIAFIAAIAGIVLIVALMGGLQKTDFSDNQTVLNEDVFKTFISQEELNQYVKDNTQNQGYGLYDLANGILGLAKSGSAPMTATSESAGSSSARASDYSETNIQVEGVDEPDIVKNDGKYIYMVSGNKVIIVDAYPAENMKNISSIELGDGIRNIFVNGDKLIVFSESYRNSDYTNKIGLENGVASIMPCLYGERCGGFGTITAEVYVYDISDRKNPEAISNLSVDGSYVDARMIGNYVYLISSKYINRDSFEPPIYIMDGVETKASASDVMYYPGYEDTSFSFTTIAAININGNEMKSKVYLTGNTGTVYVSEDNIYLTYTKKLSTKNYNERFVEEAVIPILPSELKNKAEDVMGKQGEYNQKYREVMQIVYDYSNSLDGLEKEIFDELLQNSTNEFASKIAVEYEKTVAMKISVDGYDIALKATGEVPGHLLNQFSMDEFEGTFRVATTTGEVWSGNSLNHLYVLNDRMKVVGSAQGLAPGEKIYSVRFMGERAYVVTFKKIDPFYVIDLSNSERPKVLGYLKIPGYSDYLHPYDENHIIGIGKNARGGSEQFAWYQGIKVSLFDVSDFENPREVAHLDIGDRGTDSAALQDHKAFLFDREKNLLVIPITLYEIDKTKYRNCSESELSDYRSYGYCLTDNTYGEAVWQGAYVLHIDENEIELKGKITHNEENEVLRSAREEQVGAEREGFNGNVWEKIAVNAWKTSATGYEYETYYDYQIDSFPNGANTRINVVYNFATQVQRSLFMDDVLYTMSLSMIKANDLSDIKEINKFDLGYEQRDYYPLAEM